MSSRPLSRRVDTRRPNTAGQGGLTIVETEASVGSDLVEDEIPLDMSELREELPLREDVVNDDDDDVEEAIADASQQTSKAPIEVLSQFLAAVMSNDFQEASQLCQTILAADPDNATALEFRDVIAQRLALGMLLRATEERGGRRLSLCVYVLG
eukprot:TRINITY_DN11938_c5_g1_i1.p2 TRINITY_DN11938_c5_g1~~TRINITY_DN11938_c5_g1_i1.p2  ORF type:complete len:154 (+),score=27.59 TRINITY_DN11938_c5_g1_i1:1648-2109(+)